MSTKVIVYTLTKDGEVPDYILDGGYYAVNNDLNSPQDYDILGVGNLIADLDNLPENCIKVLSNTSEIEEYFLSILPNEIIQIVDGEQVSVPTTKESIKGDVDFILELKSKYSQ